MHNLGDQPALHTEPTFANENHRIQPTARLQHSPSLPNIWFPSHPRPLEMSQVEKSPGHMPSAPPSPRVNPAEAVLDKDVRPRHIKYASIDPICRTVVSGHVPKTHARRRTERDQPHSLLTPPLTPSSSIRTTTSDSASTNVKNVPDSEDTDEEISDPEPECTRILLLENVNRQISVDELKSAIVNVLLDALSKKKIANDENYTTHADPFPPGEILKGVNERHLVSKGIIPVVFFDVRMAKLSREVLTVKDNEHLRPCMGDEIDGDGQCLGLTARLVALEELTERLGYSKFLDSIDGSFSLAVQRVKQSSDIDEVSPPAEKSGTDGKSNISDHPREGINLSTVKTLLRSIGSVRSFKLNREHVDKDGTVSHVYNVEYHDSRVASIACKEFANQNMFGLKINTLRKMGTVPFPNASTAGEYFGGLTIGSAGIQSNIRQRFNFPAISSEHPGREQDPTYQSARTVPGGAPSPPFFYTTPFANAPNHGPYQQQDPGHVVGHTMGAGNPQTPVVPSTMAFGYQGSTTWDHDVIYRSDTISPCYTSDGVCSYCPSRSPVTSQSYGAYAIPCPTPTPTYYPTQMSPNSMQGMVNVTPVSPHPSFFPYEYMEPQMHPLPSVTQWGFDPAIAAVGSGPNHLVAVNGPPPAPFFFREEVTLPARRLYQPAHFHHTTDHTQYQQPPLVEHELGADVSPQPFAHISHISTPDASPKSYRSNSIAIYEPSATGTSANAPPSGQSGERLGNQLNLSKIESGGDTRTTVMIKNIPNKMSDTDLTAYISKVCPRRIDFLYLRMDFKNGCNVGYAFVNFIKVEDLLLFAKERLGAKWNMFSSEKVLQMSYANYQGKDALIEKFKNSAIMDEREAWRPRIFYSTGKDEGLPEPFPAPTHIRRKERSASNRGALFPPGTNSHNSHHILNNTHRRYHDEYRYLQNRSGFNERLPAHLRDGRSGSTDAAGGSRQTGGAVDKVSGYRGAR